MAHSVPRVKVSFHAFSFVLVCSLIALNPISAEGQRKPGGPGSPASEEGSSAFHAYRGVELGMTADEVRKKLGEPRDKGTEQDFFVFNETETAQIVYDKTLKVVTISADFLTQGPDVITAKQVFGSEVEAKPDGSVYRMLRFPKAGYWVSFNRTSGASPMTTVTLQKIN